MARSNTGPAPADAVAEHAPAAPIGGAVTCEIVLGRRLGGRSMRAFEGFEAVEVADGGTCLVGRIADQAALHGLLATIRDLGVPLVSVRVLEARPGTRSEPGPDTQRCDPSKPSRSPSEPTAG